MGGWGTQAFRQVIRTGKGGILDPVMPWVSYARMPDEDLDAIYQALLRVPPVRHWINNLAEPTFREVCRQEHGFGDRNRVVPLVHAEVDVAVLSKYAGTCALGDEELVIPVEGDGLRPTEGDDTVELVPLSDTRFQLAVGADQVKFEIDEEGSVTHFLFYWGGIEVDRFERR